MARPRGFPRRKAAKFNDPLVGIKHPKAGDVLVAVAEEVLKSISAKKLIDANLDRAEHEKRENQLKNDLIEAKRLHAEWIKSNPFLASLVRVETFAPYRDLGLSREIAPKKSDEEVARLCSSPWWLDSVEKILSREEYSRHLASGGEMDSASNASGAVESLLGHLGLETDLSANLDEFARTNAAEIRGLKSLSWSAAQGFAEAFREHLNLFQNFLEIRGQYTVEFHRKIAESEAVFGRRGQPQKLKQKFVARSITESFVSALGVFPGHRTEFGDVSTTPQVHAIQKVFEILELDGDADHFAKKALSQLVGTLQNWAREENCADFSEFVSRFRGHSPIDSFGVR